MARSSFAPIMYRVEDPIGVARPQGGRWYDTQEEAIAVALQDFNSRPMSANIGTNAWSFLFHLYGRPARIGDRVYMGKSLLMEVTLEGVKTWPNANL